MWVRKTAGEILKERSTLWKRLPSLMLAGFFGFCVGISATCGGGGGGRYGGPYQPGKFTWPGVLIAVVLGGLAMLYAHVVQMRFREKMFANRCRSLFRGGILPPKNLGVQICNTCHQTKLYDRQSDCDCGGKFENIDDWKLVDD